MCWSRCERWWWYTHTQRYPQPIQPYPMSAWPALAAPRCQFYSLSSLLFPKVMPGLLPEDRLIATSCHGNLEYRVTQCSHPDSVWTSACCTTRMALRQCRPPWKPILSKPVQNNVMQCYITWIFDVRLLPCFLATPIHPSFTKINSVAFVLLANNDNISPWMRKKAQGTKLNGSPGTTKQLGQSQLGILKRCMKANFMTILLLVVFQQASVSRVPYKDRQIVLQSALLTSMGLMAPSLNTT